MKIEDGKLIGMVHLDPLPGSPGYDDSHDIVESALQDARALEGGGIDAVLVENYGDKPYSLKVSEETYDAFLKICSELKDEIDTPMGVNVLRNDWKSALRTADKLDLDFARVNVYTGITMTEQGMIEGESDKIQRFKKDNRINASIFSDIHVKHGKTLYPESIETAALDAVERGCADAVIVSGPRTNEPVNIDDLKKVKDTVEVPVLVGSGVRLSNVKEILRYSNGAIVGSAFKHGGITDNKVSQTRVENFTRLLKS
ncbi:MAG: BtpA/SgcQ family protein [Candidatus Saliniplasma sp.]